MQTIKRMEMERPKVIKQKKDLIQQLGATYEHNIKRDVVSSFAARNQHMLQEQARMFDVYWDLCEYVHTRYQPERLDNPSLRQEIISMAEFDLREQGVRRLPTELERRFLDVFYLIVMDWWKVEERMQWLEILKIVGCFLPKSELIQDNVLRDSY